MKKQLYFWVKLLHPIVELLLLLKNIRGIQIKQIHPITNEIVKLFVSYTDIQKELKISVKKIKELIESNEIYKGKYKFKLV